MNLIFFTTYDTFTICNVLKQRDWCMIAVELCLYFLHCITESVWMWIQQSESDGRTARWLHHTVVVLLFFSSKRLSRQLISVSWRSSVFRSAVKQLACEYFQIWRFEKTLRGQIMKSKSPTVCHIMVQARFPIVRCFQKRWGKFRSWRVEEYYHIAEASNSALGLL